MGLAVSLIDNTDTDTDSTTKMNRITESITLNVPGAGFELGSNDNKVGYESVGSYHTLHLLRGFALYVEKEGRPPTESERQADYPLRRRQYDGEFETQKFPNLIEHSDADGFYVPIPLKHPINTQDGLSIGSAQGLLEELNTLRDPLWQGNDAGFKGPEVLWEIDDRDPLSSEKRIWCQLRWLCRNAIRFNLVISF
jgi:hypothetical protein